MPRPAPASGGFALDIREVIDNGPFTRLQLRAVSLCFFLNVLDGVDVASIFFAAPLLSRAWGIDPATLGIVFSAALAGMMAGSMLLAPFGDAIGRRKLLTLSLALIAIGMLGVVLAHSLTELLVLRLVTGLGLGGVVPTMATFAAELSPRKNRNFAVTAVSSGYSLGAAVTGLAALWMVPHWGWPSLFLLGGGLTVVTLPLVLLFLPESMDFLLSKQPPRALEQVNRTLRALRQPAIAALPRKSEADTRPRLRQVAAALAALFAPRYAAPTLLLWVAFVTRCSRSTFCKTGCPSSRPTRGCPRRSRSCRAPFSTSACSSATRPSAGSRIVSGSSARSALISRSARSCCSASRICRGPPRF